MRKIKASLKFLMLVLGLIVTDCFADDRYVDCLLGHDSYAGTRARPKKTIQAMINAAVAGDVIHVAPGTYAPFNMDRKLTIIGTKGPRWTFIDGSGKYRCAVFKDVEGYELRGFTLQNGYSGKAHGGGAWMGVLRNCVIKNCRTFKGHNQFGGGGCHKSHLYDTIVEGCHAGFGGAMHEGLAHRCTFRHNYAMDRGGALWNAIAHQSLLHGNICDNFGGLPGGGGAHGSRLYNCTITLNIVRRLEGAGGLHGCYSYNCIVWGNKNHNFPAYHEYRDPCVRDHDHYHSDPHFKHPHHPEKPDFHLRPDSPCRRVGNPDFWQAGPDHWDRDRNPRFHVGKIDVGCYQEDENLNSVRSNDDGTYTIKYNPCGEEHVALTLDGEVLLSATTAGEYLWQPQTLGKHTNVFTYGVSAVTSVVNVTSLPYAVRKDPNPPMPLDPNVVITPATRNIKQTGAGHSVTTTGSTADWEAAASEDWILLTATSGKAGLPVAYTVGMNTNAEERVGYVYVSGHVHTIKQAGVGSTLDKGGAEFASTGGVGTVTLTIAQRHIWKARPNCDWISVMPTNGMSSGVVAYTVAPLYDVTTRSGTITVGGNTFTVFQYGRRMGLSTTSETRDHYTHVIPITVNALAITEWDVTPNNSWISVVDAGNGKGSDLVTIAISENPSFAERTGTVTIGTETFRITQAGRTDVAFEMSPEETTGNANGANGRIAILATPDLPWVAESRTSWLTVAPAYAAGAGNGNVAYTVNPNTTVYDRTGTIVITPDRTSGLPTYIHTVNQPAATVALSSMAEVFDAPGGSKAVTVTVSKNVKWQVEGVEDIAWLSLNGATEYLGTVTLTFAASANDTIFPRSGEITIAGKTFTVTQLGRGVNIEYESRVFDMEGGMDSISVHPDGDVAWTAVASDPTWITFPWGDSGSGDGELAYIVSDYIGDGDTRTGTITIGNQVVKITQTAYPVDISPKGSTVAGNSGAGEFSVSADIDAVWNAIATEPWITISATRNPDGSGKVVFYYTENNTGVTRQGRIEINGTEYTLTQQSRTMVSVGGVVDGHGGTIANAGSYDLGAAVKLEAIPDAGYKFLYWTLPDGSDSMVNPLTVMADVAKNYTAKFEPLKPELISVESGTEGVNLTWKNLAWALQYHIYRGSTDVPSEAVKIASIENDGSATYLDATGEIEQSYFYWVEAEGMDDLTMSPEALVGTHEKLVVVSKIIYQNLKGATHNNPETYTEETSVVFTAPTSTVEGYTFAGWSPVSIGVETRGTVKAEAQWTPNAYTIVYNSNGGSGTMSNTETAYDEWVSVPMAAFVRGEDAFLGWATTPEGEVVYRAGESIRNLTGSQNGVVTLYAVWEAPAITVVADPVVTPADGAVFVGESCTVTISCATPGAKIYYSTTGSTPKQTDKYLYQGPFTISATTKIIAVAVYKELKSAYVHTTITQRILTLESAVGTSALTLTTGGDAPWTAVADASAATDGFSVQSGVITDSQTSWLETTVNGAGTFSFRWKVSCEKDDGGIASWDHLVVTTNGVEVARIDGVTDWAQMTLTFNSGANTIRWAYVKDESESGNEDCAWIDDVVWSPASVAPAIPDDPNAVVTGDAATGFTIKPSSDKTSVEVNIPNGVDAGKVTIELSTSVTSVKPNGAQVKIVKGVHNITDFLDIPSVDASGIIDLTKAAVKAEIVKETLDPSKGAIIELKAEDPTLTTPVTRPGLTYTLREGATLDAMREGASKLGDGNPWTPPITVKGGKSGFYTIRVTK